LDEDNGRIRMFEDKSACFLTMLEPVELNKKEEESFKTPSF